MEEHQDKHMIGGIMSLVSGACGVLGMVTIIFVLLFIRYTLNKSPMPDTSGLPFGTVTLFVTIIYGILGLGLLILGVLGIAGGVFALKKRHWGLALAGAIAGTITFFPCGVVAVIFIAMARPEFVKPKLINIPGM